MDKRNLKWITWIFAIATVLTVAMMLANTLHRDVHITLPAPQQETEESQENAEENRNALSVVEIAPDTVQSAIATLRRPEHYCRTIKLEHFWNGGSAAWTVEAYVMDHLSRADRTMPDGRVRHTVTNGESTYIWYNNEREIFAAPSGGITADNDQNIPTYEEILEIKTENILFADYRRLSDVNCIYLETIENEGVYKLHYWVSVDTGLLVAAEKLQDDKLVYTMSALTLKSDPPTDADFTLPDGRVLSAYMQK